MRISRVLSWTVPEIPHLECFRAVGFVHGYPRHSHSTWAIGVVDEGTAGIWYRGANELVGPGGIIYRSQCLWPKLRQTSILFLPCARSQACSRSPASSPSSAAFWTPNPIWRVAMSRSPRKPAMSFYSGSGRPRGQLDLGVEDSPVHLGIHVQSNFPLRQPECPVEGLPEKLGNGCTFRFFVDVTRDSRREQRPFGCNVPTRHLSNGTVMTQTLSFHTCCNS